MDVKRKGAYSTWKRIFYNFISKIWQPEEVKGPEILREFLLKIFTCGEIGILKHGYGREPGMN